MPAIDLFRNTRALLVGVYTVLGIGSQVQIEEVDVPGMVIRGAVQKATPKAGFGDP